MCLLVRFQRKWRPEKVHNINYIKTVWIDCYWHLQVYLKTLFNLTKKEAHDSMSPICTNFALEVCFFIVTVILYCDSVWNTSGCSLEKYTNSQVVCTCNHLTNFAILLSVPDAVDTLVRTCNRSMTVLKQNKYFRHLFPILLLGYIM